MSAGIDIFKFKHFQIAQNKNVHRVGTDGVLLGAWTNTLHVKNILDVGTGTGVIALMLAQRSQATLVAIETEHEAFTIARQNFEESLWKDRLEAVHTSLQNFYSSDKFDLIVCNPPFFTNSLKPPVWQRQQQRHTDTLSQHNLIESANRLLTTKGRLAVVLPTEEGNAFVALALNNNLYVTRSCAVFTKVGKPQERWLFEFGRTQLQPTETQLHMMDAAGRWTDAYKALTRDFYLNF